LIIENCPAIQEQDGLFVFPDRFYHVCASGQTARIVFTSSGAWINVPNYKAGVKDRDAPVTLGKRGNREKDAEQKRQQQWKNKPFHLTPCNIFTPVRPVLFFCASVYGRRLYHAGFFKTIPFLPPIFLPEEDDSLQRF
jgi:hypothetical protein